MICSNFLSKSAPVFETVLVGLYEEPVRPQNAVEYVRKYLGGEGSTQDTEKLNAEIISLKEELAQVKKAFSELSSRVEEDAEGGEQ